MITGERKPRKASLCLPPNWNEISDEVKELIKANYPDFATRPYFSVASIDWKFRQIPQEAVCVPVPAAAGMHSAVLCKRGVARLYDLDAPGAGKRMIEPHPQDKEFLDLCRQLDGMVGVVLFVSVKDQAVVGHVPPGVSEDLLVSAGLTTLSRSVTVASHGVKPTLLPIIGTIPNNKLAGLRYALKVVSIDEELVAKQAAVKVNTCPTQ